MFLLCLFGIFACSEPAAIPVNIDPALMPKLTGTNVAGGELDYKTIPANGVLVSGTHFLFITNKDVDYLASKNMNFIRLLFSWEAIQPTLNGSLSVDSNYGKEMKRVVDYATSKNMFVMIEPHGAVDTNFVRYRGNPVGSSAVPNSAFADLWKRLADIYKGNPRVLYGLSNEPTNISTVQWYKAAQAAIDGIRSTGATQTIMIAGNGFSQPSTWNDTWYDTATPKVSNAIGWLTLKDPKNNLIVSVHTYFDQNSGGGAEDIVSKTIVAERLAPVIAWARKNKLKVHLSELGLSSKNSLAKDAIDTTLKFINDNSDVMVGWSWWAYGPVSWWGGYKFTLCPKNNYATDDPKITMISPYLVAPTSQIPTVKPTTAPPSSSPPIVDAAPPVSPTKPAKPITFTKGQVFTTDSGTSINYVYVPQNYDSTHNTATSLLIWAHGCGGKAQFDINNLSKDPNQNWISLAVGGREGSCWSNYTTDGSKFLNAIKDMKEKFNINPYKVVYMGYSSGGDIGYELVFKNANIFSGALFENTGPSTAALTASDTATWKLNIVHLAHLQDTTYPITKVRTNMTTLKNKGFPVVLIEKTGTHYDADTANSGTEYDIRTVLLPYMNAGWSAPGGPVSSSDAGIVDASVPTPDAATPVVINCSDAGSNISSVPQSTPKFYARTEVYNKGSGWQCAYLIVSNNQSVSAKWNTIYVNMNCSDKLQDYWMVSSATPKNSKISNPSVKFKPVDITTLGPKEAKKNVGGFCYDLADGKGAPFVSGID